MDTHRQSNFFYFHAVFGKKLPNIDWRTPLKLGPTLGNPGSTTVLKE